MAIRGQPGTRWQRPQPTRSRSRPGVPLPRARGPRRAARLSPGLGLLFAGVAWAVVTAVTYTTELNQNNGHDVPAGARNLPGGNITVTCDATPSEVTLFNQIGTSQANGTVGQFGADCGVATATPDPASTVNLLFEGRTQIITQVQDQDNVPVLGPIAFAAGTNAGEPIFFDADTGPPDHAELDVVDTDAFQSANPGVVRDLANATVIFNQGAVGNPFDLVIQGRVQNIPNAGAPLGEVGATVQVDIVRQGGGTIAPLASPVTTFTGPYLIVYAVDPVAAPDNPSFAGVANEEGAFRIGFDFSSVQDGVYLLTFSTRDVQGGVNPADGNNLLVTVIIDRSAPGIVFTRPANPFIANNPQTEPFCEDVIFTLEGIVAEPLTLPATVTLETFHDDLLVVNPIFTNVTTAVTGPLPGLFSVPYDFTTAPIITNPGEQDLFVTTAQAEDGAGNLSGIATHVFIWDAVATLPPLFSAPPSPFATAGTIVTFVGNVPNVRVGAEDLEEHGTVDFELTVFNSLTPTLRTTFVVAGTPSTTVHDSQLDVIQAPVFPVATTDNILGLIPDRFDFTLPVNVSTLPDGNYLVELQTIDQACNRSLITTLSLCIGRLGPVVSLDLATSGPDDNYDTPDFVPNRPPNQFGANDPVFVISLRSPERPDPGFPAQPIPVPFPAPPNDFDPGTLDRLFLSGTVTDPCTGVIEVRASGPNIPTTSFLVTPPVTSTLFVLPDVDVSNLAEGIPELLNIVAVNSQGRQGPTTSFIVLRDIVPARAPIIQAPQPLPFFTNRPTLDVDGIAEPNNLIALILPPVLNVPVAPIVRTTNGDQLNPPRIPNPRSIFNSIPVFAVTTRARADGTFSFRNVPLTNISTGFLNPTTLLVQAIDLFDNTDPAVSVTPLEIFATTGVGNVVQITIDPGTLRQIDVFPAPPSLPPTSGQFRGLETVDIRVIYDTLITRPPTLTLIQNAGAPPRTASLVAPVDLSTLTTTTLVYRYPVIDRVNDFDGPVTLDLAGGLDVFGNVPNPANVANSFFVDSVAPILNSTGLGTTPTEAERILVPVPVLAADLLDVPATVTTTASGISTAASRIQLFGPLQVNPDQEIPLVAIPPQPGFEIAFTVASPLTVEGLYRMVITAVDNVGNSRRIVRTFVFDTTGIPRAAIGNDPRCGSFVNVLPTLLGQQAIVAEIRDPTVDLAASTIVVLNSNGDTVATSTARIAPGTLAALPVPPIALDGSGDGRYTVLIDVVDTAGNATPQVTCPFILDTTAPSVAFSFPATGTCVNDPFRLTEVTLADPPSLLSTSVFSSGMDLGATLLELRLVGPSFPSTIVTGTLVPHRVSYRTTPGTTVEVALLEILDEAGRTRSLASDGREDGIYRIEARISDLAGNTRTHVSTFAYDTQEPQVVLTDFPDPSSLAGTSFTVRGEIMDFGPCGFPALASPLVTFVPDTVRGRIVRRDEAGQPVLPPVAPFFDFQPAAEVTEITTGIRTGISARGRFTFTGTIPDAPGALALFQVRVTDGAGNFRDIDRRIDVMRAGLPPPVLLRPGNAGFTNEKVVTFRWLPVETARRYDFELTRATPTALTTTTTFVLGFPTDSLQVDLPLFASRVPGGAPLTVASAFTWRIRARDVSGNPGPFSAPFSFTLDPNLPVASEVLVGGTPVSAGGTLVAAANPIQVDYSDESGMDLTRPPRARLILRDPRHPPVEVPLSYANSLMATGVLTLPVPGVAVDPNGPAVLTIEGGFDLAGNRQDPRSFAVNVDIGPFLDLRLAPNPVNPVELLFTFVARGFQGGPAESIPFSAAEPRNPLVRVRQQGRTLFETVSVNPVASTTPPQSAFYGRYTVSPNLIGFLDFEIDATDADGRTAQRRFSVAAIPEVLLKEGVVFPNVVRNSGIRLAAGALRKGVGVYGIESALVPGQAPDPGTELVSVQDLGAWMPAEGVLTRPVLVHGTLEPGNLELFPTQALSVYRAGSGGWERLPTVADQATLKGETTRLGRFAIMADLTPPKVEPVDEPGAVRVTDGGSGVDPLSIRFLSSSGGEVPGERDPASGVVRVAAGALTGRGRRDVAVRVRDHAGNEIVATVSMELSGPLAVSEALAVPNPVRTSQATLRYRLSRPADRARIRIFDTAGRTVAVLQGPAGLGVNQVVWDLARSPHRIANGVYLFQLDVEGGAERAGARGKIAVLR